MHETCIYLLLLLGSLYAPLHLETLLPLKKDRAINIYFDKNIDYFIRIYVLLIIWVIYLLFIFLKNKNVFPNIQNLNKRKFTTNCFDF